MGSGRRGAKRKAQGAEPPGPCPECGTRMVRAISGIRCPRFSACGRGGVQETGGGRSRARHPALRPDPSAEPA